MSFEISEDMHEDQVEGRDSAIPEAFAQIVYQIQRMQHKCAALCVQACQAKWIVDGGQMQVIYPGVGD